MAQPIWNTPAGSIGTYAALIYAEVAVLAVPVLPATSITYKLLSGTLPNGLTINSNGLISGTPALVTIETTSTFAIRATDNLGNIRDRTFSIIITGTAVPSFTTPSGNLLSVNDSVWVELQLEYDNPDPTNEISISLSEGLLPVGLEISNSGLIRGYASPPIVSTTVASVTTAVTATDITNIITCLSTASFAVNRPIVFSGTTFGTIEAGTTYYIKSILNSTTFTISSTQNGPEFTLTSGSGFMTATLPAISVGQPTVRTFTFSLLLHSPLGDDTSSYSITIINQNTPISQGGPGFPANTRIPTIYNTRPATYLLTDIDPYYGYYLLPPTDSGYNDTYPVTVPAYIGVIESDNYFAFKIIGHDFDGNNIQYVYSGLPSGLTGDPITGWITGTPTLSSEGINQYGFSVSVYKTANPAIQTPFVNFAFNIANNITGEITWLTPSDLGTILNGIVSTKNVLAESDVDLEYRLVSGELPPNLTLLSNGGITGYVADQPTELVLAKGATTPFIFTVQAFSPKYPGIFSSKTFTLTVEEVFDQPTDTLYIKAAPSVADRKILQTLLESDTIIPTEMLYRPYDTYFGKSSDIVYEHAYGIYASDIDEYIAAITRNHYWRNITLGEIKTAVAKDSNGNVIYEVVYSSVIDNLVNPEGVSVSSSIYWPTPIDLGLGPWYTSVTDIFTSYDVVLGQSYYTSLTPGYARTLYPNSLYNMRNRVAQVLGQEYNSKLLPLWMTSQQENGSTLGYTQAWVICYTKPGFATTIKNNIDTLWKDPVGLPYRLNQINFKIDRFSVDKTLTYNYDKSFVPPAWTGLPSATPVPDPLDSKDFYVLFPQQTILPNSTQT